MKVSKKNIIKYIIGIVTIIDFSTVMSQLTMHSVFWKFFQRGMEMFIITYFVIDWLNKFRSNKKITLCYYHYLWIVFGAVLFISSFFSAINLWNTLLRVVQLYLTIYIAYWFYLHYKELFASFYFYVCFGIQIFQLIYMSLVPKYAISINGELQGSFYHKNNLAFFMVISAIFAFQYFLHSKTIKEKIISAFSIVLSLFFIIRADSATSFVILVIVFSTYLLYSKLKNWFNIAIITTTINVLWLPMYMFVVNQFEYVINWLGRNADFTGRVLIWEKVIDIWNNKLLLGYGYNSFWTDNLGLAKQAYGIGAHNGLLELLISIGLVGTVFYYFLIVIWGRYLKNNEKNIYVLISSMYLVALSIYMLTERSLSEMHYHTLLLAWCIIATTSKKERE